MPGVRRGDTVRIHFTGRLANGTVIGSTEGQDPVQFVAGSVQMLEGINHAVLGMHPGEKKTISVEPDLAYGSRRPELTRQVARSVLPSDVKIGDQLIAPGQDPTSRVWVRNLNDQFAIIDGNHPLAGETLTFDIELVGITGEEEI